ncbi:MAG: DNA polymerase II [Nanoarchaeota archaeon]|nr:DNA polymerase II [Nanoarchaeota archaeon]MBU1030073.1 DNA polymerase II [Nanoarchaeota archaeon]MBU1850650.1 DNA polymerase II [Nanoarchaeota archaeon]
MKGFIVYPTYRIVDEKAYVHLFGRLENGESFLTINHFRPYFFIRKKDLKKALKIETFEYETTTLKTFSEDPVVKVILDIPRKVPEFRKIFYEQDVESFEADIRFSYRFMMDKNLKGSIEIKGDYKKGEFVSRIYEEPEILPSNWIPKLKVLSIDIETDSHARELFCISMHTDDFSKVIIRSEKDIKNAISVKSEKELLEVFKEKLLLLDPDIITGWNVIDFDLIKLQEKFLQYGMDFKLGRINWNCKIRKQESFFKDSTADFPGRVILDGITLLKISFVKLPDFKLDTAATIILGEKKLIGVENKGKEIEDAFKKNPQKLVEYNLNDSVLVTKILEKTGVLNLTIKRSLLTGIQLDKVKGSISAFDSLYLRDLQKKGYVAPSAKFGEREERIKGGYVMSSKPGIYDYVIVCDFKSLYPSIIKTFNIDPFTYVEDCKGKNLIKAPNGACFRKEKGLLFEMIERLWKARDELKKKDDQTGSYAIKVLMNSMFGVMANPVFRFYNNKIANAITHFGQHFIKFATKKVEELGYEVIYGDTDSIFVNLDVKNYEEAKKVGIDIQNKINNFFNNHIIKEYGCENFLELEFEKVYKRFLMPKARGSEQGSKKRYAGLLIKDNKEQMDFVGLEFVRRDWTKLAKTFQLELLKKIFRKEEVAKYIQTFVKDLKKGKHDDLLIYRKAIRKNLDEYTKTTPPHVKAARMLPKLTSSIIDYIMTINGPEPIQLLKSNIDYEHYIEKQIKPLADTVLSFYDTNFDDIINNSSQKTLFGY